MKFIEPQNEIVRVCFLARLKEINEVKGTKKRLQWVERNFTEFDGTRFKISTVAKDKQHMLNLSVALPYFKDLEKFDPIGHLSKIYGERLLKEAEMNFDFTVQTDLADEKVDWD